MDRFSSIHGTGIYIKNSGSSEKYLKSLSNSKYVKFMGQLSEADLIKQYKDCKALIITQREDFGITSLEAQSFGKPVIAYNSGGSKETVIQSETGLFFDKQESDSLATVLKKFEFAHFDAEKCIIQANKFTKARFKKDLLNLVSYKWNNHQKNFT